MSERADKAIHSMLRSDIDGRREVRHLARNATNNDDAFRIRNTDLVPRRRAQKFRDGELGRADRVRNVDVDACVAAAVWCVSGLCGARRVPEVAPVRVIYACPGAHNVYGAELASGDGEHALQLRPVCDVCFQECGSSFAFALLFVVVYEFLGFGPEREVGDEHIAAMGEQE